MKRGLTVSVAAAAILAAGLSGCSGNESSDGGATSVGSGGGVTKVLVDGKEQTVSGAVTCSSAAGNVNISIGAREAGVAAVLTDTTPPEVKSVGLGTVEGVALNFIAGTGEGDASATRNGSQYKITGTAVGVDASNPTEGVVKKPFEIDVNCP
ncbi:lipoprotein LpqH [Mycobacterium bourgelatii]|uniref:Lipoprotein LpqH n=1 Tax=Mycobacterium bourgelatii TaxID=1273442 RepID=A0A7I9YY73_MYCBU|nr:lipoprotein LpqH [Mycobacterium bourgelatii]MCV6973003.1 lipoprotein LpqH [Mycobacterium bourgelatii]GFG93467.1 lipoprotein LpqH [Mycobacterium bourgelatii]